MTIDVTMKVTLRDDGEAVLTSSVEVRLRVILRRLCNVSRIRYSTLSASHLCYLHIAASHTYTQCIDITIMTSTKR